MGKNDGGKPKNKVYKILQMKQYIDKAAVMAEIEKLREDNCLFDICVSNMCGELLSFLDTLEVEEVDFETELDEWMKIGPHTSYPWCTIPDANKITAEHFFELGLKAQKGE